LPKKTLLLFALASAFSLPLAAEPWVKPDDYGLRADIQLLADTGVIKAPVTTYPLMWNSFIDELNDTTLEQLPSFVQDALLRVKHRYKAENTEQHNFHTEVFLSTDTLPATSFGATNTQKSEATVAYSYLGESLAGKLAVNYRSDGRKCYLEGMEQSDIAEDHQALTDCDDITFDHSYLAYKIGNWVFRAGAVEQFWGPGVDNSLILTANSKPLQAFSISREKATAFESAWLSWIGPWSLTTQMAKLESTRAVPDALLWSSRVNFRPIQQLEVALSWSAQWGGDGEPQSISEFFDMVSGKSTCPDGSQDCTEAEKSKLGNQLAGIDLRWSDTLYSYPYAIYVSTIGEDASSYFKPADRAYLAGVETTIPFAEQNIKVNIEYIDTVVSCSGDESVPGAVISYNCYYEHGKYNSGYRYQGRTIGSTFDNDTESLVLTVLGQHRNGNDWQVKLRQVDYNNDNVDLYPSNPDLGHTITKNAIDSTQLELRYRMLALQGRISFGALAAKNKSMEESDTETSAFMKYEMNF